jgi:hypothetical protein
MRWIFPHTCGQQNCAEAGFGMGTLPLGRSRTVTDARAEVQVTRGYRFGGVPDDRCGGGNP